MLSRAVFDVNSNKTSSTTGGMSPSLSDWRAKPNLVLIQEDEPTANVVLVKIEMPKMK